MDESLGIIYVMAPQLHEYVIFIDSQHLVDISDVQLLQYNRFQKTSGYTLLVQVNV